MDIRFIIPPIIGAAIGWITNYVAIKLLFRPLEPIKVFGFTFQGALPKRRSEIAHSIAVTIEKDLLSSEDLASSLTSVDWKTDIEKMVDNLLANKLYSDKIKNVPVIGLVSENLQYHLKDYITKELLTQIEKKKFSMAERFKDSVDLKGMVSTRIDSLDLNRFEEMLTDFIARELKHIEHLGGIMGFLIGLIQSLVFYML